MWCTPGVFTQCALHARDSGENCVASSDVLDRLCIGGSLSSLQTQKHDRYGSRNFSRSALLWAALPSSTHGPRPTAWTAAKRHGQPQTSASTTAGCSGGGKKGAGLPAQRRSGAGAMASRSHHLSPWHSRVQSSAVIYCTKMIEITLDCVSLQRW